MNDDDFFPEALSDEEADDFLGMARFREVSEQIRDLVGYTRTQSLLRGDGVQAAQNLDQDLSDVGEVPGDLACWGDLVRAGKALLLAQLRDCQFKLTDWVGRAASHVPHPADAKTATPPPPVDADAPDWMQQIREANQATLRSLSKIEKANVNIAARIEKLERAAAASRNIGAETAAAINAAAAVDGKRGRS